MSIRKGDICTALFLNMKIERRSLTVGNSKNTYGSNKIVLAQTEGGVAAEVGVSQNGSQVSQVAEVAQLRNLRCTLYSFFQLLHYLRLRIGKYNIFCAFIANFFPKCAITT